MVRRQRPSHGGYAAAVPAVTIFHVIPYLVLGSASLLVVVLPFGRDMLVPVFLMLWGALTPDIGINLPLSKILFLIIFVKYGLYGRLAFGAVPGLSIYGVAIVVGLISAGITLATETVRIDYFGGELRNGWYRVAIVTINFVLSLLPFVLLSARGVPHLMSSLLRTYVVSALVLCMIGIVQYGVFRATGMDVIPLGLFTQSEADLRSGLGATVGGEIDLRPGSFAGEPKSLGMFAATSIIILVAFGRLVVTTVWLRIALIFVALLTIFLTQSTSAFLSLPVGMAVYLALRAMGRPLPASAVFIIYTVVAFILLAIFLERVATAPEPSNDGVVSVVQNPTLGEFLYQRSIGRLDVEDFDWVILKSFLADPATVVLGRGFGLGHLTAGPFIPDVWRHYMEGRIIFPKTGVTYYFVNGGLVFVLIMMLYLARITPTAGRGAVANPDRSALVQQAQLALIPLVVLLLLRLYVYDVALFVSAVCLLGLSRHSTGRADRGFVAGRILHSRVEFLQNFGARRDQQ